MFFSKKNKKTSDGGIKTELGRHFSSEKIRKLSVIMATIFVVACSVSVDTSATGNFRVSNEQEEKAVVQMEPTTTGTQEKQVATTEQVQFDTRAVTFNTESYINVDSQPSANFNATDACIIPIQEAASIYNPKIPLSFELQKYLYDICKERNLDYKTTLAVIQHESRFDPNALSPTHDYGLFQINRGNHTHLSAVLGTPNTPFDPITNINWGTYMLSYLYDEYSSEYSGEDLTKAVLSAYNMGEGGFAKYGFARTYIKAHNEAQDVVNSWFE